MDHEQRKQDIISTGKALGFTDKDLHVLSRDPFMVGSKRDYENAQWAANLWDRMMSRRRKALHLRGFHYWIQSQGIAKPDGTIYAQGADPAKDWGYLLMCAQMARYLGIGQWSNLIDMKHPNPSDYDSYFVGSGMMQTGEVDLQDLLDQKLSSIVDDFIGEVLSNTPRFRTDGYQVYHCEVWCEKNSMGFVIEPACKRMEATYQPLVGQSSVEKVNMAADRAIKAAQAGKKVRLFYISDYDRYGWSMVSAVARKLEFFIQDHPEIDMRVTRLALNEDQIRQFNLPKAPKHGEAVVELDALEAIHPGELANIINEALRPYYDSEKPAMVREENRRMREEAERIVEEKLRIPLQEAFQNISVQGLAGDLDLRDVVDQDFEPPTPGHDVEERSNWVFDSTREFFDQLEEFKKYKGDREEEEA